MRRNDDYSFLSWVDVDEEKLKWLERKIYDLQNCLINANSRATKVCEKSEAWRRKKLPPDASRDVKEKRRKEGDHLRHKRFCGRQEKLKLSNKINLSCKVGIILVLNHFIDKCKDLLKARGGNYEVDRSELEAVDAKLKAIDKDTFQSLSDQGGRYKELQDELKKSQTAASKRRQEAVSKRRDKSKHISERERINCNNRYSDANVKCTNIKEELRLLCFSEKCQLLEQLVRHYEGLLEVNIAELSEYNDHLEYFKNSLATLELGASEPSRLLDDASLASEMLIHPDLSVFPVLGTQFEDISKDDFDTRRLRAVGSSNEMRLEIGAGLDVAALSAETEDWLAASGSASLVGGPLALFGRVLADEEGVDLDRDTLGLMT